MTAKLIDEMSATNTRGLPVIRSLAPTYEQEDYPLVTIWTKADYEAYQKNRDVMLADRRQGNKISVPR